MADNHVKPTKEELKANAEQALVDLENMPPEEPEVETPADEPVEPAVDTTIEEEDEAPVEKAETQDEIDYKKKFSESSREAQRLAASNRAINQAVDEADQMPDPTEEELQREYAEWDDMTLTEQRLAKESLISKQFRQKIAQAREKGRSIEKWQEKVTEYVNDPKTLIAIPDLEGKVEDFRIFASEEANANVPFTLLTKAFLHDLGTKKPTNQGNQMFPTGTGGSNESAMPKDDKLSVEEGRVLRQTNYPKFKELLKAGKIKNE